MKGTNPVFICGIERCGKSILSALLTSHSHLLIPLGSYMWHYFYKRFGDLSNSANLERCLEAMLQYKHIAILNPDADRIRNEFRQEEPTYPNLFALIMRHNAESHGKIRWGDQGAYLERYAEAIFDAYPEAKVIHLIRDPRDRYLSVLTRDGAREGKVGGGTARWLNSYQQAKQNQARYPENYQILKYEDLVTCPEEMLRKVCAFIDEPYQSEMLSMDGDPLFRSNLNRSTNNRANQDMISEDFIGAFQQGLSKSDIYFIQSHTSLEMAACGYEVSPIMLPLKDQIRYTLFKSPVNQAMMVLWKSYESARCAFPKVFGSKPGKKMIRKNYLQAQTQQKRI